MKISIPDFGLIDVRSEAGCATRVVVPKYASCFDIGLCDRAALAQPNVFISHTHMDHLAGLWQHATLQMFQGKQRHGTYVLPSYATDAVNDLLSTGSRLDHNTGIKRTLHPAEQPFRLDGGYFVSSFPTTHSIPSTGYLVTKGNSLTTRPEFAYTGDTSFEFFAYSPAREARVLVMECTYTSPRPTDVSASAGGHIYLDDLIEGESLFDAVEHLILMHFCYVDRPEEFRKQVYAALPRSLAAKTFIVADGLS